MDDLLVGYDLQSEEAVQCHQKLVEAYRWGKWQENEFSFTGCQVKQMSDHTISISQENYTNEFINEIPISKERQRSPKSAATPEEVSQLRGAIGTMAWRASQTSPHYQADAGLLLSEIPYATVDTILKVNKVIREMKRDSKQKLIFPSWNLPLQDLCVVGW